jgi:hypothetical protein
MVHYMCVVSGIVGVVAVGIGCTLFLAADESLVLAVTCVLILVLLMLLLARLSVSWRLLLAGLSAAVALLPFLGLGVGVLAPPCSGTAWPTVHIEGSNNPLLQILVVPLSFAYALAEVPVLLLGSVADELRVIARFPSGRIRPFAVFAFWAAATVILMVSAVVSWTRRKYGRNERQASGKGSGAVHA